MMRKFLLLLPVLLLSPSIHAAELKVGDPAPSFTAKDETGKTISLSDFKGKAVLLYFYPMDNTPGCIIEAQSFRDHYSEFQNLDTVILGINFNNQQSHQDFKTKQQIPYPLLVDADHAIAKAYGVKGDQFPSRDVIQIDDKGKIMKILRGVNPSTIVAELLKNTY